MKTYNEMGKQANKIAKFLRNKNHAAHAGPALGGLSIYPVLARNANMGGIGRHGLLITPEFGPRQRIAVIYTNISNLPIPNSNSYQWITEFCKTCVRCMEYCPTKAIYDAPIIKQHDMLTHIDVEKCAIGFLNYSCSICLKVCTFNRNSYDKLKKTWKRKQKNSRRTSHYSSS